MIAQLFPEFYDVEGHKVFSPGRKQRRAGFRPTLPMGRNLTAPLEVHCKNLEEVRQFLRGCHAQDIGRKHKKDRSDHWQPPEEFEQTRAGDCVDFALWTWRQLLDMGYKARFTGGRAGKFGEGHAWVTFEKDGKFYLLEPQFWPLGLRMSVLSALRYHPITSVGWDGEKISYYAHENRRGEPPFSRLPTLFLEWIAIWGGFWLKFLPLLPFRIARNIVLRVRGTRA
jgi:Transglutaminase-like domain